VGPRPSTSAAGSATRLPGASRGSASISTGFGQGRERGGGLGELGRELRPVSSGWSAQLADDQAARGNPEFCGSCRRCTMRPSYPSGEASNRLRRPPPGCGQPRVLSTGRFGVGEVAQFRGGVLAAKLLRGPPASPRTDHRPKPGRRPASGQRGVSHHRSCHLIHRASRKASRRLDAGDLWGLNPGVPQYVR